MPASLVLNVVLDYAIVLVPLGSLQNRLSQLNNGARPHYWMLFSFGRKRFKKKSANEIASKVKAVKSAGTDA